MIPSPAELTYFLEVAATLNLSRASERLGISQPSLRLAMKRLEETTCHGKSLALLTLTVNAAWCPMNKKRNE